MGREKKNAAQDVLNLYSQMQEEDSVKNSKEELKATIQEIELAKDALTSAKTELTNAYCVLESTRGELVSVHRGVSNIVDEIVHVISQAEQIKIKVGIDDKGLSQLNERNNTAIEAFKQALDEQESRMKGLLAYQQNELKRIQNIEDGAYFNGRTYWWMFGFAFVAWVIIIVEITIWIYLRWFR